MTMIMTEDSDSNSGARMCQAQCQTFTCIRFLTDTSPLSHKYNYKLYMITEETFAKVKSPAQDHMLVF